MLQLVAKEEESQKTVVDMKESFLVSVQGRGLLKLDSIIRTMRCAVMIGALKQWHSSMKAGLSLQSMIRTRIRTVSEV